MVSEDGMRVELSVKGVLESHIHDFDLAAMRGESGEPLLHHKAYYTVNEVPVGSGKGVLLREGRSK